MEWHFVIMAILGILGAALAAGGIVAYRASARVSVRAFGAASIAAGVVMWAIILLTTPISGTREDAPAPTSGSEAARYEVTVQFNDSVTQEDMDEAGVLLRTFDDDIDFLIMEIFPPVGHAVLVTDGYVGRPRDASDFCQTVQAELEAKRFVDSVSCRPWQEPDQADPDAPVSTDNRAG